MVDDSGFSNAKWSRYNVDGDGTLILRLVAGHGHRGLVPSGVLNSCIHNQLADMPCRSVLARRF